MVRVNLIDPKYLSDQHLVAEYAEILILAAYARAYPDLVGIPANYCLGTGHQKFFKNKLKYLKTRHEKLKKEMRMRGFRPRKTLSLRGFGRRHLNNWKVQKKDFLVIEKRLIERIRLKPEFYRYYGEYRGEKFLVKLVKKGARCLPK